MTARVIVTGSPGWTDLDAVVAGLVEAWRVVGKPTRPVLVSARTRAGADHLAESVWALWGWVVEPRPNANLVALGADLMVAFPLDGDPEVRRRIASARAAGIPVRIFPPTVEEAA